jgi:hypothetical protein
MRFQDFTRPGFSMRIYPDAPSHLGVRTCAFSDLSIDTAGDGIEALDEACTLMREAGFGAVLAPMRGDTWHAYRVVTWSDGSQPFVMEPTSGPFDNECLERAGFVSVAGYSSAVAPVAAAGASDFEMAGVSVASWSGEGAQDLLVKAYEASMASFVKAAYFKPISCDEFMALYLPYVPMMDPRLVLFASDSRGVPVGFLFGMPDLLALPGDRRAVLKTYAGAIPGVGRALAQRFHILARDLGFTGVVHALMRDDNGSRGASVKFGGRTIRRYALMGKTL